MRSAVFMKRTALLKIIREKEYSVLTRYEITKHIANSKTRDLAPEAIEIVEESKTEQEALQKILNLK